MLRTALAVGECSSTQDEFVSLLAAAFPGIRTTTADSVRAGRSAIASMRPEIAVMELHLPDGSGAELLCLMRLIRPSGYAIVVGDTCDSTSVLLALNSGARGYLLREESPDVLIRQMRSVARGELSFSPQIAHLVMGLFAGSESQETGLGALSERQRSILALVAVGLTTGQMAARLGISPNTIETHLKRLYAKLSISSRVQAARVALQSGLIGARGEHVSTPAARQRNVLR